MKKNGHLGARKLIIANRGEIARRILKACRKKMMTVAVIVTQEDKNSLVCREADAVLEVDSFLNAEQIVAQAKKWGAHLLHPGYGFLSENAHFAQLCEDNDIVFIGPTSDQIKRLGSKESSKKIAQKCDVPVLDSLLSTELKKIPKLQWKSEFEKRNIHAPYLIKASGGGGGRGMRIVQEFDHVSDSLERASHEALSAFNDATVFVERYLQHPRHIEVQIFGDGKGDGIFLGERECSMQRRHQKVIEECPSVIVDDKIRKKLAKASLSLIKHTKYRGAGTVEFLFDENKNFYFLEMNTRLQVEHPVTEMVYGIDLVQAQIDLALGTWPFEKQQPKPNGVAIETRILAENPRENFLPTPGKIEEYLEPIGEGIRVDSGVEKGSCILPSFDSMIAKLIVHAPTRAQAVEKMSAALKDYVIFGITTNIPFLISLVNRQEFLNGDESTHFIEEHLSELNQKLVPESLIKFMNSVEFREKLLRELSSRTVHVLPDAASLPTSMSRDSRDVIAGSKHHVTIFSRQKFLNAYESPHHVNFEMESVLNSETFNGHKSGVKKFVLRVNPTVKPRGDICFFASHKKNGEMTVNVNGEIIHLEHPDFHVKHAQAQDQNAEGQIEVKAPMAGKVYEVLVKLGDSVKSGDLLFIIESMKMQLEVRSSQSGTMTNIFVEKGQILTGANSLGQISL